MPEEERAHAGGVMGGAQLIGIAATTAAGGLEQAFGAADGDAVGEPLALTSAAAPAPARARGGWG